MGNESSFFKRCTIQNQPYYKTQSWSLYSCCHELKQLNLFVLNNDDCCFDISTWKSIRHPYILKYYDNGLYQGRKAIVTEPADPISHHTSNLTIDEIICGLHNICESLSFIHETCMISHNCITLDSIFLSPSNYSWKLGCLQLSTSFGYETKDKLDRLHRYLKSNGDDNVIPPEDAQSMRVITTSEELHRRDSFAIGRIFQLLLGERDIELSETIRNLGNPDPSKRPKISTVLAEPLFKECDYLTITSTLGKFASLAESDKEIFLSDLVNRLRRLPITLVAAKLIPLILTTRFLLLHPHANQFILPYLFICIPNETIPEPLITEELFKIYILPVIFKLYLVHNIQVRLILYNYLSYYLPFVSQDNLKSIIIPQIKLGMEDEHDELVAASYKSFGYLIETFGARKILGNKKKLFNNVTPKLNVMHSDCSFDLPSMISSVSVEDLGTRSEPDGDEKPDLKGKIDLSLLSSDSDSNDNKSKQELISKSPITNGPMQLYSPMVTLPSSSSQTLSSAPLPVSISSTSKSSVLNQNNNDTTKLNVVESTSKSHNSRNGRKSTVDFVDIKTIDFKPINGEEVDQLFSDMEPKLKFVKANNVKPKLVKSSVTSLSQPASSSSFKFEIQELEGLGSGWNEDEESWDADESTTKEATSLPF